MKKTLLLITTCICFLCLTSSLQAQWSKLGTGAHGLNETGQGTYTMCLGVPGDVYVAGWLYDSIGNTIVSRWDGVSWNTVGLGSNILNQFETIDYMIADSAGNIYAGGEEDEDSAAFVAKWNGSSWDKLGGNFSSRGQVEALCFDKFGNLYAAGTFYDTSGYCYVAKWDGTSWSEVGTSSHVLRANSNINTICTDTFGNLYAAGHFTDGSCDTDGNLYVARWDGSSWNELGTGVCPQVYGGDGQIFTIVSDMAANIYVGGQFYDDTTTYIARWDGTSWSRLELDSPGMVFSLCFDRFGNLYTAGVLGQYEEGYQNVFKWDGISWSELGTGADQLNGNGSISQICTDSSGNIFATGLFTDTSATIYFDSTWSDVHPYYVAKYTAPPTSVAPLEIPASFGAYPNPSQNIVHVSGISQATPFRLINTDGDCIGRGMLDQQMSDISMVSLSSGIYILVLVATDGTRSELKLTKKD